jgi:hypothetical protein
MVMLSLAIWLARKCLVVRRKKAVNIASRGLLSRMDIILGMAVTDKERFDCISPLQEAISYEGTADTDSIAVSSLVALRAFNAYGSLPFSVPLRTLGEAGIEAIRA